MAVYAACGGSTNFLLHLPAIAHAAGLPVPPLAEWKDVNARVPRLVDALPNGPASDRARLPGRGRAGGDAAPARPRASRPLRARRHRRDAGRDPRMVGGLGAAPPAARESARDGRRRPRRRDPAAGGGAAARVHEHRELPRRQPRAPGRDREEHRHRSRARSDPTACTATPARRTSSPASAPPSPPSRPKPASRPAKCWCSPASGPAARGWRRSTRSRRRSGTSSSRRPSPSSPTRASPASPPAPASGTSPPRRCPAGPSAACATATSSGRHRHAAARGNDRLRAARRADGTFVPADDELAARPPHPALAPDPDLPADTRLWAALQDASGGPGRAAVYDVDRIVRLLEAGRRALGEDTPDRHAIN